MRHLSICLVSLLLSLSAPVSAAAEQIQKIRVLGSIRPLALLAESLAGERVETEVLLQAGDSPHHLALRVSQLAKLERADLVVWVGPGFERFLEKPLAPRESTLSLAGLKEAAHEHEYHHGEQHLWLDPQIVRAAARALSVELIRIAPEHKVYFETGLANFLKRFDSQDSAIRARFAELDAAFISYHPAFSEYVSAYQLNQLGSLIEGSEHAPGARSLAELKQQASRAACLLVDVQEFQAARRYASLLGLSIEKVDVLGENPGTENWFEYYQELADAITRCLSRE